MGRRPLGVVFYPVGWEDTLGGVGRPQELINEDLRQCDYAVFVLHDRWGSPPGNGHSSGTEEEWALAENLYQIMQMREIVLLFKAVDSRQLSDPGAQLCYVINFKRRIESEKRRLYHTYNNIDEFSGLLEKILAKWMRDLQRPSRPTKRKARTKIGKAVEGNEKEINLAIAGLLLQIDDKLEELKNERPNSPDAIAIRGARISEYDRMRAELESIGQMIAQFKKGVVEEAEVVRSVTTFAGGIRSWWSKSHSSICTRTFDLGLFTSSVCICSMAGAGGKAAIIVSAALVGGTSVAGTLRGLTKNLFAD